MEDIRVGLYDPDLNARGAPQQYFLKLYEHLQERKGVYPVLLTEIRPEVDILHFNDIRTSPTEILQTYAGAFKKIATVHGEVLFSEPQLYDYGEWYQRMYMKLTQPKLAKLMGMIIAVSKNEAERISKYYDISRGDIQVIYHGIDHTLFKPINDAKDVITRKYGIKNNFILHVSNYSRRKNPKVLFSTFAELLERGNDLKLVIVGGKWREHFSFQSKKIHFVGRVPKVDLPLFYSAAEVFFFPSLHENFGFPNVEAMACGTPVVTSNAYAIPEIVEDYAFIRNPRDIEGFVQDLDAILNKKITIEKMISQGITHAKEFTWEKCAEKTFKVYKKVMSQTSSMGYIKG